MFDSCRTIEIKQLIILFRKGNDLAIIKAIRTQLSTTVLISIDTRLSTVAKLALAEGANIINDISAGYNDPKILKVAADYNCPIILMHIKGTPQTMQDNPNYDNVVSEVLASLHVSAEHAKTSRH